MIAFWQWESNIYLLLAVFTSTPTTLLVSIRVSVFFFGGGDYIYMLYPNSFPSSQASSWHVPFNFSPFWFFCPFLMAYSKAKLKGSEGKASPCSRPLRTENASHKCLPTWALLYVSHKHILVTITSFVANPKSMRIQYKYYTHHNILFHMFQCISGLMTSNNLQKFPILNVNILTMQELAINNKT
jgi:hypothetical protein